MRKTIPKMIILNTLYLFGLLILSACSTTKVENNEIATISETLAATQDRNDNPDSIDPTKQEVNNEEPELITTDSENMEEQISGDLLPDAETLTDDNQFIPKTILEATNPSSVNLASGGIQFIEYFAYW